MENQTNESLEQQQEINLVDSNEELKPFQKKSAKRFILYAIEAVVLLVAVGILYVVTTTTKEVDHINLDEEKIAINEEVKETMQTEVKQQAKGYRNIALFGVDARDGELGKGTRSDTIIIASINQDTQEIRLMSVYRDTYLNLGNDSYNKCNAAYAKGGPEQAINMLNTNLDLNITDYVTVGFAGLIDAVNALGGIEMDVTDVEISHLNNYQLCMAEELGVDYTPVTQSGRQLLNGMQATAYCRIRYTKGDDFRRAERQRDVLSAMMTKAKGASVGALTDMVNAVLPQVETSLNVNDIISVLGTVAGYEVVSSEGFPFSDGRACVRVGSKGECVVPDDLVTNVVRLHETLYPEKKYDPSKQVEIISAEITSQINGYR